MQALNMLCTILNGNKSLALSDFLVLQIHCSFIYRCKVFILPEMSSLICFLENHRAQSSYNQYEVIPVKIVRTCGRKPFNEEQEEREGGLFFFLAVSVWSGVSV